MGLRDDKFKTYAAGQVEFPVPADTRTSDAVVFCSDDCEDTLLSVGFDYLIEGGTIRLIKEFSEKKITVGCCPNPELDVPKIGPIPKTALEPFANDVRGALAFLQSQISRAIIVPFGADRDQYLRKLCAVDAKPVVKPAAPVKPKRPPPIHPAVLDDFLGPVEIDLPLRWCNWPYDLPKYQKPAAASIGIHKKPFPAVVADFCKTTFGAEIAFYGTCPKPHPAQLEFKQ